MTVTADRPARTPLRSGDPHDQDPFDEIPGVAPNMGQDVLPHVVTFQGLLRNVARTYYVSDEAVQHSWDNARFMRNDPGIMECLEQRQRSTALLDWRLQAEDEEDPTQKMLVDELTAILKQTPGFLKYRENLLHALWYGKYGVSHRFRWKRVKGQMRIVLDRWRPVNGDKLVFRYDDGSGEYDDDQVGIRVGAGYTAGSQISNRWKIERFGKIAATDHGLAYFLEHWERPLLAIHKHMIEDAEYEAPDRAGALHGVGIRNRLYWLWYQKQETLAWLMEYLERSAFGIEIWSYPAGNKEAYEKTKQAAQERIGQGRNIVLVPRHADSDVLSSDVRRIEPGMAGADILDRIIREYFGHQIKRYILGQILTSEAAATGLGSGVASIHLDTYLQIVRYDSINLAETITTDLVDPLIRYNWPRLAGTPVKFVIETESPDIEGKLSAWERAYHMGLEIPSRDVADLIGAASPQEGEETLRDPQHVQTSAQLKQQQQGQQLPTPDQDAQKLFSILGGTQEQYKALRPGMERLVYDRRGQLQYVERYRATPDSKVKKSGDEPGWKTVGGGARVFIGKEGSIVAGCPGLEGEDIDEIGEDESSENRQRREHRKDVAKAKGLGGDELTPEQTERLEDHPHPETGKDADGQQKAAPTVQQVEFGNREYEVRKERDSWFFRLNESAGWTMASEETAAAIEEQVKPEKQRTAQAKDDDTDDDGDIPFDIPEPDQPGPTPAEHSTTKINPRTRVGKAILATAQEYSIAPDDMADSLEYAWEQRAAKGSSQRQKALEVARKLTGLYPSEVKRLKNSGFDHTSARRVGGVSGQKLAHFDEYAQEIAREYPQLGLGDPDDPRADFAGALWNILDEDRAKVISMDDPGLLREAAEMVIASRQYDEANVLTSSYEEFRRRGQVERYRKWQTEKYGKKPAKGQMAFQWNEDDHPRDADGKFATGEGAAKPDQQASLFSDQKPSKATSPAKPKQIVIAELDSMTLGEVEAAWRETFPNATGFPPGKSGMIEQIKRKTGDGGKPTKPPSEPPAKPPEAPEDTTADFSADTTPRDAASDALGKQVDSEYAFARSSSVPNVGEDVLGSARHTRNAWRGLEEAEKDGTAAELVTRDKLLKNEPHNLMVHVTRNPLTTLTMHHAVKSFPAKPGYGRSKPTAEESQKNRQQYLDAYRRIKEKAEDLAASEEDPKTASKALGSFVSDLIREYRGQKGNDYMASVTATDKYNQTANSLCSLSTKLSSTYRKSSILRNQNEKFAKAFAEKYSDLSPEDKMDKLADHVGDVIEGASLSKTFGTTSEKAKAFRPADLYVKIATREGGREMPTTAKGASDYMTGPQQFRGIQFGNSMTDDERQHHVTKCTEAFADLADVLGIPEEYTSWKGKLAIAFGARGKGGAVAHYEPSQVAINLTRKNGVGSLAHEWGHFFDHQLAGGDVMMSSRGREALHFSDQGDTTYEYKDGKSTKTDHTKDPMWQAFDKVRQSWESSGFSERMKDTVHQMTRDGLIGKGKYGYWTSNKEVFARAFERYVQRKLESSGRKNTYLAGIETKSHKNGGLWPTDAEVDAMTPHFDEIFKQLGAGIEKGKYWLRDTGERIVLERSPAVATEQYHRVYRGGAANVAAVTQAAEATDRNPTEAKKIAGNYRKGKCRLHGLEIAIETPQGAVRRGRNKRTGREWSIEMPYHYGYIKRTESEADGDHIDVFLGPDLDSELVFVIDQVKPGTGRHFDEHKVMIGWKSAQKASAAYHECYEDGWQGFEAITPMTVPQFREWAEKGTDRKASKP